MRFTLPILSMVLLLLTGEALARPSFPSKKSHNATLSALIAKRQTSRNEIQLRAHIKDTVKRVHTQNAVEREEAVAEAVGTVVEREEPTRARLVPRQNTSPQARKRALPAPVKRDSELPTRAHLVPRQNTSPQARKRALPKSVRRNADAPTPVRLAARQNTSPQARKRALPAPMRERAAAAQPEVRRSRQSEEREAEVEPRSSYPKCKKSTARTGYAHYPGWKLVGDELSGAIPVSPESACIQACNKYGGACSGVFFDSVNARCFLKGVKTSDWSFVVGADEDGTDLIGGCSLWSNIVPEEMDAVCCRD